MRKGVDHPQNRASERLRSQARKFQRSELEREDCGMDEGHGGVGYVSAREGGGGGGRRSCVQQTQAVGPRSQLKISTVATALGRQHSKGHLEPRGAGVGMASHTVNVCECHPAGHWTQGGRVSAVTPLASGCSKSATCLPASGLSAPAAGPRIGPWLPRT